MISFDDWQLSKFWQEHAEWSRTTFGADDVRGPTGPLKHLAKEVQECLANPTDLEEYADLMFLTFDACRRAGFTLPALVKEMWRKLEVNKNRKWGPPTIDGAVEHIRDNN